MDFGYTFTLAYFSKYHLLILYKFSSPKHEQRTVKLV